MSGNKVSFGVEAKGVGKASSDVDKLRDKFEKMQKTGGKGLPNFAAGAALGGIALATAAVAGLTDVIGDSIQAAIADEESQNRLRASLKANVPAWDGNTDAIERNILSKQRLAFDDETLRNSLSVLVGATHDVTKAQEIQNTAMDLARFKGIDLQTASEALIKVEGGQYRSLKQLGIKLRDGATATEALAAVQKVARGQAEAYANTSKGKLEASQIAVGEVMENLGGKIMPIVTDAFVAAGKAANDMSAALEATGDAVKNNQDPLQNFANLLHDAFKSPDEDARTFFGTIGDGLNDFKQHLDDGAADINDWWTFWDDHSTLADRRAARVATGFDDMSGSMTRAAYGASVGVGGAFDDMGEDAEDFRDKYHDVTGDIIRRSGRMVDKLIEDAARLRGDVFDETEIRADLHDTRMELHANEERLRTAKTAEAHRQASDDIAQSLDDEGQHLEDLAGQGKLTSKDVDRFAADAKKNYKSLSKEGRKEIDDLIKKYRALANMPNINKSFTVNYKETGAKGHAPGKGPTEFGATGGRFNAGTDLVVGEEGWERMKLLPGGGAIVTDHAKSKASLRSAGSGSGSVGGGNTFNVTVNAGMGSGLTAGSARQLAEQVGPALVAYMQRTGQLARTGTGLRG